jgi:hypothetical protein
MVVNSFTPGASDYIAQHTHFQKTALSFFFGYCTMTVLGSAIPSPLDSFTMNISGLMQSMLDPTRWTGK